MHFDRVINGIIRYLNAEVYIGMNDWQEMIARMAVSRLLSRKDQLRESLIANPFVKTFGIIDDAGMVDVDGLLDDIRVQISEKGKLEFSIPMFGKFTFRENDVDRLRQLIMEG